MIGFIRKLWNDRRGNTLAIAAACMPLVVGAAGLATDTIQWTLWKRQLQRAADSAAMSGVYTDIKTPTDAAVAASVTHDNTLNLHTWMSLKTTPTVTRLPDSGQMTHRVYVKMQVQQSLPFSSIFMSAAPIITAEATAASVPDGAQYCVIGLDPSAKVTGITISGSTTLDLGSCSLIADSTNPTLAASNGSSSASGGAGSTVTAASIAAAGGVNYSKNWTVGSYNPYATPVADPFASLVNSIPTSSSGCTKTASINGNGTINRTTGSSPDTASDVVCLNGDQTVQGNVTLGPATYIVNAGDLKMNTSNASLSCDGCTIILTNFSSPANTGTANLTGGTLSLSPPRSYDTTGSDGNPKTVTVGNQTWAGVAIYQDPRASDSQNGSSAQNKINGNSALSIQGVVYFGNQSLEFVGGGSDNAACLQVVAKRVTFSGNSKIKASSACGNYGLNPIGGGRRVKLVA